MTAEVDGRQIDAAMFESVTGRPLTDFAHQCHVASLLLVKARLWPNARVLRGGCAKVPGQHSWIALTGKEGVYDERVTVVDPTMWSYTGEEPYVWVGLARQVPHRPHGAGRIMEWGRPERAHESGEDEIVVKPPLGGWTPLAAEWLRMLGPLGRRGWMRLFDAPMADWPAGEILEQAEKDERLSALIPIDRLGMLTDLNPGGLYLPGPAQDDPMALLCDGCGAEPGEECRPGCVGMAAKQDAEAVVRSKVTEDVWAARHC